MFNRLSDQLRSTVYGALASDKGNAFAPLRIARNFLGTANDLVGRPFASAAELAERRAVAQPPAPAAAPAREAAPVVVYFDGKDHRTKKRVEDLLKGRDIPFRVLDVSDDEATRSWAVTQAKLDEFPLVFVAGEPVGDVHALVQADVSGALVKRVFGR